MVQAVLFVFVSLSSALSTHHSSMCFTNDIYDIYTILLSDIQYNTYGRSNEQHHIGINM